MSFSKRGKKKLKASSNEVLSARFQFSTSQLLHFNQGSRKIPLILKLTDGERETLAGFVRQVVIVLKTESRQPGWNPRRVT